MSSSRVLERKSYGQSVVTRSGYGGETTTYGGDTHNFHSTHTALHRGYAEPATTSFVVGKGDCACNVKITVTVSSSPKIATNVTTINDTYDFNKRYVDLDLTRGNGSVIVSTNGIIAEQADRPASVHTYNTTKRLTSHESDIVRRSNTPSYIKIDYPKTRASHIESSSSRASNLYSTIQEPVNSSVQWREVHSKSSHTGPTITEISNAEDQFGARSQANVSSQRSAYFKSSSSSSQSRGEQQGGDINARRILSSTAEERTLDTSQNTDNADEDRDGDDT